MKKLKQADTAKLVQPMSRLAFLTLGIAAVGTGCVSTTPMPTNTTQGLVDLSQALQYQRLSLGNWRSSQSIPIAFTRGEARGGYMVEGIDVGEVARLDLLSAFQSSRNYRVLNRTAMREVTVERKLAGGSGPAAAAKYIIRSTITQVQRGIKKDGTASDWRFVVGGGKRERNSQGAVEVALEIVDTSSTETIRTARGIGLLEERETQSNSQFVYFGTQQGSYRRIPVRDAVRAACVQAATDVDGFFEQQYRN